LVAVEDPLIPTLKPGCVPSGWPQRAAQTWQAVCQLPAPNSSSPERTSRASPSGTDPQRFHSAETKQQICQVVVKRHSDGQLVLPVLHQDSRQLLHADLSGRPTSRKMSRPRWMTVDPGRHCCCTRHIDPPKWACGRVADVGPLCNHVSPVDRPSIPTTVLCAAVTIPEQLVNIVTPVSVVHCITAVLSSVCLRSASSIRFINFVTTTFHHWTAFTDNQKLKPPPTRSARRGLPSFPGFSILVWGGPVSRAFPPNR
jgi:hypothetical protein